jgi:VWFA-related protein
MRRLVLLGLLAAMVPIAGAARRVTVAQLEQTLSGEVAAHRADAEVARQLGELELSERLTGATLDRFAGKLALGPRMALALQLLADRSAFLDPPADELPATAFPDPAAQQRMMDAARGYVAEVLPRLPNFFATRTTNRFDDTPQVLVKGDWPVRAGLHLAGTSTREITFRDGREIQDPAPDTSAAPASASAHHPQQELGLHSWGEFGPELSVILTDTAKGTVTFDHWEQASTGLVAVYRYAVPRAVSHYTVDYCCVSEEEISGTSSLWTFTSRRSGQGGLNVLPALAFHTFTETPGYHGSLLIDPASGAILRIALEAELSNGDPLLRAATVVEYGPVAIGDRRFICPVRSLAFSVEEAGNKSGSEGNTTVTGTRAAEDAWTSQLSRAAKAPILLINETSFTHYRRLGSSMRIMADTAGQASSAPGLPGPASASPVSPPTDSTATAAGTAPPSPRQAAADQAVHTPPPSVAQPEPAPVAPPPVQPAAAEPVIAEVSLSAATGIPDEPSHAAPPGQGGFQLKLTSRLVDVGIVAYDKKGHPVRDLRAEDFEVYDNGRRQEVRFFSRYLGEPAAAPPADAAPDRTFANRPANASAGLSASTNPETGATVLLIDEGHIAWGDLTHAREEMLKFLAGLVPGERVGLYTMTRTGFRVLVEITADHAALAAGLKGFTPQAQSVLQAQDEEMRNRQQFNEVHNPSDLDFVNGNHVDKPDDQNPVDPQFMALGSDPARASLILLAGVARHLAAIPGHKSLVWVSTDNVFVDWENQAVGVDRGPKPIDSFALHAQEAMNEAHVAVFPLDVSQLEGGAIGADVRTRNVELTQAAAENATLGGTNKAPRNMTPGRITAEMQQDIHPIQGPIRQVADATGGRSIRRAGDLAAALAGVVEDGHATYMVSFTPQGPADGEYHNITVKLAGKHPGLTLRYRTGYLFEKEPGTLKERFKQAVWRPRDVSEIAVTSAVESMTSGANLKIGIAASDLGLAEQAGRWEDKLDIFLIQRDDAGQHAQIEGQTLGLRLKPSTYQNLLAGGVPFERFVQMKPGMASLRVLVVDENSGRMGSITIPSTALGAGH